MGNVLGQAPGPERDDAPDRRRRLWLAVPVALAVLVGAVIAVPRWLDASEPVAEAAASRSLLAGRADVSATSTTVATTTTVAPTTTAAPPSTESPAAPVAPLPPARATPKKGVAVWGTMADMGRALTEVGAAWYYNWSADPTATAGGSSEFVPMIWGPDSVDDGTLARAEAAGSVLLGFNEPDFGSQSNMSVEQALDLWPRLQATGLRLGSPAVAINAAEPGGWLDRFLSGARDRGLRVDFIALHWYGSDFGDAAVGQLRSYIEGVHDRYGLPIWLTEYALIKFADGGSTYPSDAQQAAFVTGSTAMLESLPYVERYAWFALPTPDDGSQGTGLYRSATTPTPAGVAYRAAG